MNLKNDTFGLSLIHWYKTHGRHDLPWQKNMSSYRVWISEIMLQQTQVATVIPYYQRFMQTFPDIITLANASEDSVLSHWSGLGYYARARNLHQTAKIICKEHEGELPNTVEALSALPGIGRSTAGAILSFSRKQFAVILDGNVKRVLTRAFAFNEPLNRAAPIRDLWNLATALTPKELAHQYNQAIMDLGATICTRSKPKCTLCPFSETCEAYRAGEQTKYPVKIPKKPRKTKQVAMLIGYNDQGQILLCKRPSTGIWGGLWSFPEIDVNTAHNYQVIRQLPVFSHQFTHFILNITPICVELNPTDPLDANESIWYKPLTALPGGIAAPVAKILKQLEALL